MTQADTIKQVAQQVLDRMNQYLVETNANVHGAFATSRESEAVIDEARAASADFLGASPVGIFRPANGVCNLQSTCLYG